MDNDVRDRDCRISRKYSWKVAETVLCFFSVADLPSCLRNVRIGQMAVHFASRHVDTRQSGEMRIIATLLTATEEVMVVQNL